MFDGFLSQLVSIHTTERHPSKSFQVFFGTFKLYVKVTSIPNFSTVHRLTFRCRVVVFLEKSVSRTHRDKDYMRVKDLTNSQ